MKINKKEICLFVAIVLFISSQILPSTVNNLDEIWNFNFARCISNGLIPYKDFNIIQGPLLPLICALFLKIFGQQMIVTRFLAIILDSAIIFIIYKIMCKLELKEYLKYFIIIILAIIMKSQFTIDYNWSTLLLTLIIIYLELYLKDFKDIKKGSWKLDLLLGFICALTVLLKQTTGIVISFATIGWKILTIRKLDDVKRILKIVSVRFIGFSIIVFLFIITLLYLEAFYDYIDYCILSIQTFSNKISYIERLINNKNIIIKVLSIVPVPIYFFLIFDYIKNKKNESLILLIYSVSQMIFVYPISDEAHFVIAIVPTLISMAYIFNLIIIKLNINKKVDIILTSFIESFTTVVSILFFIYGIFVYNSKNINLELNHFKYLPMEQQQISEIKEIEEFIETKHKNVYILDAVASLYMIPIDKYNKDYDMFLKGNLGSKGEEGQISKIQNEKDIIILIKNEKYKRNWQNPEKVRKYIINNMNKTGKIGVFDIYE